MTDVMTNGRRAGFAMVLALFFANMCFATTYYVSMTGDDTNPGTSWDQAFRTVEKGVEQIHKKTTIVDELVIGAGHYSVTNLLLCQGNYSQTPDIVRGETGNPEDVVIEQDAGTKTIINLADRVIVHSLTFSNGYAATSAHPAGGIRIGSVNTPYSTVVSNCIITGCAAASGTLGAGAYLNGGGLLTHSVVRNCSSGNESAAICLTGNARVHACTIENNTSTGYYAALIADKAGENMKVSDCVIRSNTAPQWPAFYQVPCLTNCVISNNVSTSLGVAAYSVDGGTFRATDCLFEDNRTIEQAHIGCLILGYGSTSFVHSCTFRNNTAVAGDGGAIRLGHTAKMTLTDCFFEGNSARSGGAISFVQNTNSAGYQTPFLISNCVFAANAATLRGGAFSSSYGNYHGDYWGQDAFTSLFMCGMVQDCVFTNNVARYLGGAIFIREKSVGGQDYAGDSLLTIRNCLFARNAVTNGVVQHASNGGAFYLVSKASPVVESCTFVTNRANYCGGAIWARWAGVFSNCVFAANLKEDETDATDWLQIPAYSCCADVTPSQAATYFSTANGCVTGDPRLADIARDDYTIASGQSPCVNAGVNQAWMVGALDLAGNDRILEGRVDMGCYEYKRTSWGLMVIVR
ncbi:MAG TPA: hypothetical protein PLM82_13805 [Candidatus Latescibacteria bacterium]|nr:hypothetical protein [Candidatus Latescibacterota bacterium]